MNPNQPTHTITTPGARIVGADQPQDHEGPGPYLMTADTLNGNEVRNSEGEDLGKIEDIMLDVERGRIAYAVLSFGGFLGMGNKLFAIPWQSLTLDAEQKCFILEVPQEKLKAAPGFDQDHWPSMADPRWQGDIDAYYGTRPYWE